MKCPKCNSESTYQRQYTDGYSCNNCSYDWEVPAPAVKDDARIIELINENKQLHKTIEMQGDEWCRLFKENQELKYGGEKITVGEGENSVTYYVHGKWVKMEWTEFIAMKFPSAVKDDWKEQLRFCLDTIIKSSYEDISHAIRRQVVKVDDVEKAFSEYFDVKPTEPQF